ncbi:MAG: hypothetical protein AAGD22_09785 [Verrucomicrobiota bacterium]
MITKLNLLTTFGALILFFLPWIDIQCNQRSMITQSGFQTITGGGTLSDEFKNLQDDQDHDKEKERPKPALLVAVAFLLALLAFGLAVASAFGRRNRDRSVGILTAIALACILAQMTLQFPAEKEINHSLKPDVADHDGDKFAKTLGSAFTDIKVLYRNPLYFELALLALPTLLLLNTLIDKRRAQQSN